MSPAPQQPGLWCEAYFFSEKMSTSPKQRRPRAEKFYINIPDSQLILPLDHEDQLEKRASVKLSAPTPGRKMGRPACPQCGHKSGVHAWKWWKERKLFVYHCTYMHGLGAGDMCEHMWVEAERRALCAECKTARVRIEEHARVIGYCCDLCNSFNSFSDNAT
jgi:hypothetical protein